MYGKLLETFLIWCLDFVPRCSSCWGDRKLHEPCACMNVVVFGLLVLLCAVMVYAWATPQLVFKTLDVESGRLGWPEGYAEFLREVKIAREDVGPERLEYAVVPVEWIKDNLFAGPLSVAKTSSGVVRIVLFLCLAAGLVQCLELALKIRAGGRTSRDLAGDVVVLGCVGVVFLLLVRLALVQLLLFENLELELRRLGEPDGTAAFMTMVDAAEAEVEQGTSTTAIVDRVQIRDGFFPLTIYAIKVAVRVTTFALAAAGVTALVQGVIVLVRATRTDTPKA